MDEKMLVVFLCVVVSAIVLIIALITKEDVKSRINGMMFDIDTLVAENSSLMRTSFDLKTRIEMLEQLEVVTREEYEPTAFEKRIEQFKAELNTPTYPDNVATTDKGTYNLPHDVVDDVPLRAEEEYAI